MARLPGASAIAAPRSARHSRCGSTEAAFCQGPIRATRSPSTREHDAHASTGPGRSDGGGAARGRAAARRLRRRWARGREARGLPGWRDIPKPRVRSWPTMPARAPASRSFNCGRGRIEEIDRSRIVTDTPVEVIFEVTYRFSATSLGAASLPCSGASTRWFTFDREGDGQLSLAEMADTAPEPASPGRGGQARGGRRPQVGDHRGDMTGQHAAVEARRDHDSRRASSSASPAAARRGCWRAWPRSCPAGAGRAAPAASGSPRPRPRRRRAGRRRSRAGAARRARPARAPARQARRRKRAWLARTNGWTMASSRRSSSGRPSTASPEHVAVDAAAGAQAAGECRRDRRHRLAAGGEHARAPGRRSRTPARRRPGSGRPPGSCPWRSSR